MMTADLPDKVQNLDVANLCAFAMRGIEELGNCASATRDQTNEHDLKRAQDFLGSFSARFDVAASAPELDLPKYHPHSTVFSKWPTLKNSMPLQNADLQGLVNIWQALVVEMAHSDSAERSTGFSTADKGRVEAVLTKIGQQIQTIEGDPEVDLPDASDQAAGGGK